MIDRHRCHEAEQQRMEMLTSLATLISGDWPRARPMRVGIDGVDTAGKTTLADELSLLLSDRGLPVIRATIDGFHRPRAERNRDPDLPRGYFSDSYDHATLRRELLDPLAAGGDRRYRRRAFDFRRDEPVDEAPSVAAPDAVLLFDGIFLQREELRGCFDLVCFLQVDFEEVLRRACLRDRALFGDAERVLERYRQRYIPGQGLYLSAYRPAERADVLIDNQDPAAPRILRMPNRG